LDDKAAVGAKKLAVFAVKLCFENSGVEKHQPLREGLAFFQGMTRRTVSCPAWRGVAYWSFTTGAPMKCVENCVRIAGWQVFSG
jgi:hypothetical protein